MPPAAVLLVTLPWVVSLDKGMKTIYQVVLLGRLNGLLFSNMQIKSIQEIAG